MKKTLKLLTILMLSAFVLTGCGTKSGKAIVKVNDKVITQGDYDKLFNQTVKNPSLQAFGLDSGNVDKNSFMYIMIKDKVVNELIIRSLIDEEVKKRHIVVSKKDTDAEMKEILDKVGSKAKFKEVLKKNGVSMKEFKQDLVQEVKMKKLVDTLQRVSITEADAQKFYNENKDKFKYPDRVRASHILVSANPEEIKQTLKADKKNENLSNAELDKLVSKEMAEKLKTAQKLLAEVKKDPSSFAAVAKENSDDVASAKQGGDLGFFGKDEMVEAFSKQAFSQKPNTISDIVKTPYGYHIIMVTDRKAAGVDTFDNVKYEIILYLENEQKVKALDDFISSLKKYAKIDYVNNDYTPTDVAKALQKQESQAAASSQKTDSSKEDKKSKK